MSSRFSSFASFSSPAGPEVPFGAVRPDLRTRHPQGDAATPSAIRFSSFSSLGFGGPNFHLGAPPPPEEGPRRPSTPRNTVPPTTIRFSSFSSFGLRGPAFPFRPGRLGLRPVHALREAVMPLTIRFSSFSSFDLGGPTFDFGRRRCPRPLEGQAPLYGVEPRLGRRPRRFVDRGDRRRRRPQPRHRALLERTTPRLRSARDVLERASDTNAEREQAG
jgi:hypothetical protein